MRSYIMNRLIKIEVFTDDDKNPITPKKSTIKYVTEFKEEGVGIKKQYQEYSSEGFNVDSKEPIIRHYMKTVSAEAYDETKHARGGNPENTGQFSKGGGGSSQTYDTKKLKRQSKHEKPKFPSKPQNNPNAQTRKS